MGRRIPNTRGSGDESLAEWMKFCDWLFTECAGGAVISNDEFYNEKEQRDLGHGITLLKPKTAASMAAALLARLERFAFLSSSSSSRGRSPTPPRRPRGRTPSSSPPPSSTPSPAPSRGYTPSLPSPIPLRRDSDRLPRRDMIPPELRRRPRDDPPPMFLPTAEPPPSRRRLSYSPGDSEPRAPREERVDIAHNIIPILLQHITKPSYAWHLREEDNAWLLRRDNNDRLWCVRLTIGTDAHVYVAYRTDDSGAPITHIVRNVDDAETMAHITMDNIDDRHNLI
jgi:hypothetical protein